jgi:hypothetical protein
MTHAVLMSLCHCGREDGKRDGSRGQNFCDTGHEVLQLSAAGYG